jgi:hypothetical protein
MEHAQGWLMLLGVMVATSSMHASGLSLSPISDATFEAELVGERNCSLFAVAAT